jgi:hypothetical protein
MSSHGHHGARVLGFGRTALLRVAMFFFSTALSLIAAEGIARIVVPRSIAYPWMDHFNNMVVPLPSVHGRHFVPGSYDTSFSFSAQRFRGQQLYTPQPDPGTIRIALLGSSSTFGSGANDVETYPFKLQAILQERAKQDGSKLIFEVINAGIPGTVVAEQALWYDSWVKRFHPQIVVLNIACAVDFVSGGFLMDDKGRIRPRSPDQLKAASKASRSVGRLMKSMPGYIFLSEHSELFNLLILKVGGILRQQQNVALADDLGPEGSGGPAAEQKRALSLESAEVMWLKEQAEQSGGRLVVIVVPCRENIYSSDSPQADEIRREFADVVNVLRDITSKANIPFADLAPRLRPAAIQSPQLLYYDGRFETHPTPAGYWVIADEVARFLRQAGVVQTHHRDSSAP